jgi:hypothetical protein
MATIEFTPRWREELVATSSEGILIFELTMGKYHVYFPSENKWLESVSEWAKDQWQAYFDGCSQWCSRNNIPMTVVDNALVYEEKAARQ